MYTIGSGKKIDIRKILKDTKINLSEIKSTTTNYFILKIPFSYTEIKAGTFDE